MGLERKPTIVLVHGAFADSSGFDAVIRRLLADGYPVVTAPNPLRGVASDAAAVTSLLGSIVGPVVLVGHSYGGAVISTAAAGSDQVRALVYLAAFIPDAGEAVGQLVTTFPGSTVNESLKAVPLTGGQVDLYIDPAVYHARFAADVPVEDATVYAITQRPAAATAFDEPVAGPQAWRTIPAFTLISGADMIIPPEAQEFMAKRAESTVRIVDDASHLVFVSHPETTVALIEQAAQETAR